MLFYAELRSLVDKCAFDYKPSETDRTSPLDEMLRDRIVLGIRDDAIRKKLISQGNTLTLDQAVRVCRSSEVTSAVMQSVAKVDINSEAVDAVRREASHKKSSKKKSKSEKGSKLVHHQTNANQSKENKDQCTCCAREPGHPKKECPTKEAECQKCSKIGHYAAQCRSKSVQEVMQAQIHSLKMQLHLTCFLLENFVLDSLQ